MFSTKSSLLCLLITAGILPMLVHAQNASTSLSTTSTTSAVTTSPAVTPPLTLPQAALSPVAQTRIRNLTANVSNRQDAIVKRLDNVRARIESRLQVIAQSGTDVSAARAQLATATEHLNSAKTNLAGIDRGVETFIGSTAPQENWLNLKRTYADTTANIVAAHSALLSSINALDLSPTGTSTTPTSTSTNPL